MVGLHDVLEAEGWLLDRLQRDDLCREADGQVWKRV